MSFKFNLNLNLILRENFSPVYRLLAYEEKLHEQSLFKLLRLKKI